MQHPRLCRVCAAPLTIPATGRPPRYCSVTCRRQAEYELKRINLHLSRVEWERDHLRDRLEEGRLSAVTRRAMERRFERLEADVARYEASLRRLLDYDEPVRLESRFSEKWLA